MLCIPEWFAMVRSIVVQIREGWSTNTVALSATFVFVERSFLFIVRLTGSGSLLASRKPILYLSTNTSSSHILLTSFGRTFILNTYITGIFSLQLLIIRKTFEIHSTSTFSIQIPVYLLRVNYIVILQN